MYKTNISLLALFLFVGSVFGQTEFEMGSWRAHFPYHQTNFLALDHPIIYAAGYSGFFTYNLEDYTIERYNSMNSLSDVGVSAFRWHSGKRVVIIGYQSGQIDIFNDGKVINVSDIYRAEIIGSKQIKHIKTSGDTAFIITSFGVSVMNMNSYAILSTYRFGTSDSSVVVNDLAVLSDSLYVATDKGVYTAPRQGLNLLDFGNWKLLLSIPDSVESWDFCEEWADTLWIGKTLERDQTDLFYKYKNGDIIPVPLVDEGGKLRRLHKEENYLNVVTNTRLMWYNPDGELVHRVGYFGTRYSGASDMVAYDEWRYFVADPIHGINAKVKYQPDNKYITPNGPAYTSSYHVNVTDDEVWVSGGSHGQPWSNFGIYRFKDNFWTNYNKYTNDSLDEIRNISLSITDPRDSRHVVAGSFGYGVVEFMDGEIIKTWDTKNSTLENISSVGYGYNRVTGLAF
ncbi:MAG: hypothetical protein PHU27_04090, partial [Salinivirgaceae bacterium]|nr:hypothetical protein [Salinivirgaceae bacterium]